MRLTSAALALSLSVLALAPHAALADTLTLTSTPGGSVGGVSIFPYAFTVTTAAGTALNVPMSCLNFDREISVGETWNVYEVGILSIPAGGIDGESRTAFLEDAYLYDQYAGASAQQTADIQFAIWAVMDPAVATSSLAGFTPNAQTLLTAAQANYGANLAPYANDLVFIPINGSQPAGDGEPQIFIVDPPPSNVATPEPSSLMLFGTGLLGTVGILRRRQMMTAPVRS